MIIDLKAYFLCNAKTVSTVELEQIIPAGEAFLNFSSILSRGSNSLIGICVSAALEIA